MPFRYNFFTVCANFLCKFEIIQTYQYHDVAKEGLKCEIQLYWKKFEIKIMKIIHCKLNISTDVPEFRSVSSGDVGAPR